MEPFSHNIGAASALSGSFRFLFTAIAGSVAVYQSVSNTLPLAIPAIGFSVFGLCLFLPLRKTLDQENGVN